MRADNNDDDNEEEAAKDLRDLLEDKLFGIGKSQLLAKEARILSLSNANDPANPPLHKAPLVHRGELPEGAKLLAIGTKLEEFDIEALKSGFTHGLQALMLSPLLTGWPRLRTST